MTKVHVEALRYARDGYEIVLVGHRGHVEVEGTLGHAPGRMHLVETRRRRREARGARPDQARGADADHALGRRHARDHRRAARALSRSVRLPGKDDICYATQNRQNAVKDRAARSELVLVVGAPSSSSNSNRLVEVARGARRARASWSRTPRASTRPGSPAATRVGVTAGASTPEELVQAVCERLRALGAHARRGAADRRRGHALHASRRAEARAAERADRVVDPLLRTLVDGLERGEVPVRALEALGCAEPATRAARTSSQRPRHADLAATRERVAARAPALRASGLRRRSVSRSSPPATARRADARSIRRISRRCRECSARATSWRDFCSATRTGARSSTGDPPGAPDDAPIEPDWTAIRIAKYKGLLRIAARDLCGRPFEASLAELSQLADRCLAAALARRGARERTSHRLRCSRSASSAARSSTSPPTSTCCSSTSRRRASDPVELAHARSRLVQPSRNTWRFRAKTASATASISSCGPRAATA